MKKVVASFLRVCFYLHRQHDAGEQKNKTEPNMSTKPTMTPREQRDLLYAIREQDAPSPYALVANRFAETDTINKHFTVCEAAPDLLAALESIINWTILNERDQRVVAARAAIAKAKGDK